ncbi:gamma-glutamyl kinase [Oscillochloris trichoides DG-6]|uniref:Glutamate 5-kinase n=1 Tax=Oscillochloris trichoides DG-6 TaxID=765420 RepID=E1IHA5_9CHLR|nr:glutamate 5-kinase [Oscillochloris trichoides]EFO79580.1 gamma-glutamyl kinase [Oscillochloris trichoides DG-6]
MSDLEPIRLVIKLGTSVLTAGTDRLNRPYMVDLARQVAALREAGVQVALVSSGAIAAGRERLGSQPQQRVRANVPLKQMFAAVGQSRLMHLYEQLFELYGLQVAQVLLTRDDLRDRRRYLNARNTLSLCIERGIVPIINENDALVTAEIRVGDNDNLSALVAGLIDADLLLILTDIDGLYNADPRTNPDAKLLGEVDQIDDDIWEMAGGVGSARGTGGMRTKIQAADLATRSGTSVVIANGATSNVILRVLRGERIGTSFPSGGSHLESRKRWLLAETARHSKIVIDAGAANALLNQGKSLLPAGVIAVEGHFERGQTIRIYTADGHEIARGLTQYSANDVRHIQGLRSGQIAETLGYDYGSVVVHRDDMVVLG